MIRGVLLDLAGVLYDGDAALPGAADAVGRLRDAGLPLRYLTNTTRRPRRRLLADLDRLGLPVAPEMLFTPAASVRDWLAEHGHAPHLLVHPDLEEDFADLPCDGPPAVVVGDAGRFFTYDRLNAAFRLLDDGAPLLALAANRVFRDADGRRSLDAGAFVAALAHAARTEPRLFGKPAPAFFETAAASLDCPLSEVAMVGDDAEADIAGALAAGAGMALLVRTGKYRPGNEERVQPAPSAVVADIGAAAAAILSRAAPDGARK